MMLDATKNTIGELALQVPAAITVLEKWQIDYCCRGHRTISEACESAGVSVEQLMVEIGDGRPGEVTDLEHRSLREIQQYVVETHHAYTRDTLETVRLLADKVANRHGAHHPEVVEVRGIVGQMINDLLPHMLKEEQVLFPYIENLELAVEDGEPAPVPFFGTVKNPIRMMLMEHETVGDLLVSLRAITSEYKLPADACLSYRALYERLAELEQDLHRHIHVENNLLFPRAVQLEESAGSSPAFGVSGVHNCSCNG